MIQAKSLRIAVLTDIHAFTGPSGDKAPSWIALSDDQSNPIVNPFAGLQARIAKDGLTADIVICCGDMGDKASPDGQQYVWSEVSKLKTSLGASLVLGTAGNHDLDSRFQYTSHDARGQIQSLEPPFPVEDELKWMEYWAKNFTTVEHDGVRFLLLNSAAYHGYASSPDQPEYAHGRVSDRTLTKITSKLKVEGERGANVLICHHHPFKNDHIVVEDYSQMENGDRLINALIDAKVGPWLVVHGHKHMPRIFYAPGGNATPTIFSAGSFSAKLYAEYADRARNEFYILELQVPDIGTVSSLKGKLSTWQWSYGNGWVRPKVGQGLGPSAAFGARLDVAEMAHTVANDLKGSASSTATLWNDVTGKYPNIGHLIPEDLSHFLELLQAKHGMRVLRNDQTDEVAEIQVVVNG